MSAATRRDAIERALIHHQLRKIVCSFSPPGGGRSTWLVQLDRNEAHEYSTPQIEAFLEALADVERQSEQQRQQILDVERALSERTKTSGYRARDAGDYVLALQTALKQLGTGYDVTRALLRELSTRTLGLLEEHETLLRVREQLDVDEWSPDTLDMIAMAINDPQRYAAVTSQTTATPTQGENR